MYPMVPGHEIIGKVTAVGNKVTEFKVGRLLKELFYDASNQS